MAKARQQNRGTLHQVAGLAPMLLVALLSRTGATMVGLSMGFVAHQQTASALTVAIVASSFGLAFAASSMIAGHVLQHVGLRMMLVGALISQVAGALTLASVTNTASADVTWLIIFRVTAGLAAALIFVGSQMLLHGVAPSERLRQVISLDSATLSLSRGLSHCPVLLRAVARSGRGARGAYHRSRAGAPSSSTRSRSLLPSALDPALGDPHGRARRDACAPPW